MLCDVTKTSRDGDPELAPPPRAFGVLFSNIWSRGVFGCASAPGTRNLWAAHLILVWDKGLSRRIPQEGGRGRPADTILVPLASEQPEKSGALGSPGQAGRGFPVRLVPVPRMSGALEGPQPGGSAAELQPSPGAGLSLALPAPAQVPPRNPRQLDTRRRGPAARARVSALPVFCCEVACVLEFVQERVI